MAIYTVKAIFADHIEIGIEADSYEEAVIKYNEGDWLYEHTLDYHCIKETQGVQLSKD